MHKLISTLIILPSLVGSVCLADGNSADSAADQDKKAAGDSHIPAANVTTSPFSFMLDPDKFPDLKPGQSLDNMADRAKPTYLKSRILPDIQPVRLQLEHAKPTLTAPEVMIPRSFPLPDSGNQIPSLLVQ